MPDFSDFRALAGAWLVVAVIAGLATAALWFYPPRGWPPQRRRVVAWSGPHVASAFVIFWFMPALLLPLLPPKTLGEWFLGPDANAEVAGVLSRAAASTLALPLQLLAWRGLLCMTDSASATMWSAGRAARNVRLGYLTWLVFTPWVYVVYFIALVLYARVYGKPNDHPLLAPFLSSPVPAGVVILLVTEAVIAAPIREEMLFRGILLPWLADRDWGGDGALLFAALIVPVGRIMSGGSVHAVLEGGAAAGGIVIVLVALRRWLEHSPLTRRWLSLRDDRERRRAVGAIVGSSAIFAICHFGVPPTPVPLALLSVGLGWLALRTQGVTAPIVVHALFNAVAFAEFTVR